MASSLRAKTPVASETQGVQNGRAKNDVFFQVWMIFCIAQMLHVTAIFTYIWREFMINVDKYSIDEACGYDQILFGLFQTAS